MSTRRRPLSPEAQERMVRISVGRNGGTSIRAVVEWVFGRRRTARALDDDNCEADPELVDFALMLEARVAKEWAQRGIPRSLGPYVVTDSSSAAAYSR